MEDGEEDEEEEVTYEIVQPKKRIGRPPKVWSSVLLPKEVMSTLGNRKPKLAKSQKVHNVRTSNSNEGEGTHSKVPTTNMVGQTVHGVVDGCFDAGFLVTVRMGDSDPLYRGVVFGPGLSIPVSKETDIAKNVKRRRRKRKLGNGTGTAPREEPSTPPPSPPAPAREEGPPPNAVLTQAPPHYEAPPPQQAHHPNSVHGLENPNVSPPIPPPHPHQFAYNGGALHANNFRSPRPHPEMNNPYMHSSGFPPRPTMPMPPAQGYSPRQNFGHVIPSPSAPYGYNFAGTQGRPSTPLPPQYRGPADPQYRGT